MFNPVNESANWPSAPNPFIFRHQIKWRQIRGGRGWDEKHFFSRPADGLVVPYGEMRSLVYPWMPSPHLHTHPVLA